MNHIPLSFREKWVDVLPCNNKEYVEKVKNNSNLHENLQTMRAHVWNVVLNDVTPFQEHFQLGHIHHL